MAKKPAKKAAPAARKAPARKAAAAPKSSAKAPKAAKSAKPAARTAKSVKAPSKSTAKAKTPVAARKSTTKRAPKESGLAALFKPVKQSVTIRLDSDVVSWFKKQADKYQTEINSVLRGHASKRGL